MNKLQKLIKENIKRGFDKDNKQYWLAQTDVILDAYYKYYVRNLLLSHSFAKSWWGSSKIFGTPIKEGSGDIVDDRTLWQYHLQQLILLETVDLMVDYYWENK